MKKTVLIFIFSLVLIIAKSQNNFNYQTFLLKKIKFHEKGFSEKQPYLRYCKVDEDSIHPKKVIIPFKGKYGIKHICNEKHNTKSNKGNEYIEILKKRYSIDSLLSNTVNVKVEDNSFFLKFYNSYEFSFKEKKYLLLSAIDNSWATNIELYYWFLIDITKTDSIRIYSFIDASEFNPNCFGFYADTNKISYMSWEHRMNKIQLYTLEKDKFVLDTSNFVYVTPNEDEKHDRNGMDYFHYSKINLNKTQWIYKDWLIKNSKLKHKKKEYKNYTP